MLSKNNLSIRGFPVLRRGFNSRCSTSANLTPVSDFEKDSIVIDVRPDEINQFKGKASFRKKPAHRCNMFAR